MIGKVINVFLPENDLNKIGFKVQLEDEVLEIIQEQNEMNQDIFREDLVSLYYLNNNIDIKKIIDE